VRSAVDLRPRLFLRSAGRSDERRGLVRNHAIGQHHLTDPDLVAKPRRDSHEQNDVRAMGRDGARRRSRGTRIPRAADAAQRDGVVPVGQFGAHGAPEVHGPVGVLLSIEIIDPQHPARCVELRGNDRQDHDVDGFGRRSHRSRTHHTLH
jgi:hypothetical protein